MKGGPRVAALKKKSAKIAQFIGERVGVNYIPAVRTENQSNEIISTMVSRALRSLEKNTEYQEAVDQINQLQRPILDKLANTVTQTVQLFIPQVIDIKINLNNASRLRSFRSNEIIVNDGTPTPIEQKGDGIKSLTAISLL